MPETPSTTPEPPCPICGAPVADADYPAHLPKCRDERSRAARQVVLDRIKKEFPTQYEQALREFEAERKKKKKGP